MTSALHVHLVFVTKYRRGVLEADMLQRCQDAMRKVSGDFGADLRRVRLVGRSRAPAG